MGQVLCALDEIPDGASRGVLPNHRGRDQAFVVRKGQHVVAYVNNCPHYDRAPLGWKKHEFLNAACDRIVCSAHGALFRIDDGLCVIGPCVGQSLQAIPVNIVDGLVVTTD